MKRNVALLALIVSAVATGWVGAQVPRSDGAVPYPGTDPFGNRPFSAYDQQVAAQRSEAGPKVTYKLPPAMQIVKRPPLMPAKPQLVAPTDAKVQQTFAGIQTKQKDVLKRIEEARSRNDFEAVARLMVTVDELRQERLAYLREVGERVIPEAAKSATPESSTSASGAPESRPILPIPTLAPSK